MTLVEALRSTNRVRLRMWPAGRYWEFNDDRTNFKVPGTEITRETLTLKQIFATEWEPFVEPGRLLAIQ